MSERNAVRARVERGADDVKRKPMQKITQEKEQGQKRGDGKEGKEGEREEKHGANEGKGVQMG